MNACWSFDVAVPPWALRDAWDGERFHLRVRSSVNGVRLGDADAGQDMFFTYPQLIAHAARTRRLSAGTIALSAVSLGIGLATMSREESNNVVVHPPWITLSSEL